MTVIDEYSCGYCSDTCFIVFIVVWCRYVINTQLIELNGSPEKANKLTISLTHFWADNVFSKKKLALYLIYYCLVSIDAHLPCVQSHLL